MKQTQWLMLTLEQVSLRQMEWIHDFVYFVGILDMSTAEWKLSSELS